MESLRTPGKYSPPIIPALKSEFDASYFDDFANPDIAGYDEIKRRHKEISNGSKAPTYTQGIRASFVGFTFKHDRKH